MAPYSDLTLFFPDGSKRYYTTRNINAGSVLASTATHVDRIEVLSSEGITSVMVHLGKETRLFHGIPFQTTAFEPDEVQY